jgi:hypothetical protein
MVEWLAGNRIKGTSTERTVGTPEVPAVVTQGGWKELARHTLGSNTAPITVSSLPDKLYYMVLKSWSGNTGLYERINNDSGSNYSARRSQNGNTDSTLTSETAYPWGNAGYSGTPNFAIDCVSNLAGKEKLILRNWMYQNSAGAGNAPDRVNVVAKWANTSDTINRFDMAVGSGSFNSGAEMVVLGWDPDDTHTTNFWEELADVTTGSTGALSSGTFTAKKYLWVQAYTPSSSNSSPDGYVEFNADSGTNYAHRRSHNGGSDTTGTSDGIGIRIDGSGGQTAKFHNMFIVNNSANEKLVICNSITQQTAGAGTAPTRTESVGKWVNTSDQITRVDIIDQYASDQWGAGSFIKVWGHD